MRKLKFLLLAAIAVIATTAITAQIVEPVKWEASVKKLEGNEYLITYTAKIDSGWSIYDLGPYEGGPIATTFVVDEENEENNKKIQLVGKVTPKTTPKKNHDAVWGMKVGKFYGTTTFTQKVKLIGKGPVEFAMIVEWQACDATSCIAPTDEYLTVIIK